MFSRIIAQFANRATITKKLKKAFHRYTTVFQKLGKTNEDVNTRIMKNTLKSRNLKQNV